MLKTKPKRLSQRTQKHFRSFVEERKNEILRAPDELSVIGVSYFVSADGNDDLDGKSPDKAWKSLARVCSAELNAGDGVFFRRGDTFRGFITAKAGVTYAAYGEGDKPRLLGWDQNLALPELWTLCDEKHNIYKLNTLIPDCGTLVFNEGERHSVKLIPSYRNGAFVCRNDESKPFVFADEATRNLDIFCRYDERTTTEPSKGEDFPVPVIDSESLGELYIRCDEGNPGEVFSSIEALVRRNLFSVGDRSGVRIDNLCMKYIGAHAVSAGEAVNGLTVTNCEIGWVGGSIQHYLGTDPNYPEGKRGSVTRYGNGVEIYGGCNGYTVSGCYIHQVYDAGITHQITTFGKRVTMENILYSSNLIEKCVYGIEYFLEKNCGDTESYIKNCKIEGNIILYSGYGWGQQRHNEDTPALIKGWSYENTASDFVICGNAFAFSAYRMLHLVAKKQESLPVLRDNLYLQSLGLPLGQYGANELAEPEILTFDKGAAKTIHSVFGDKSAKILYVNHEEFKQW